MNGVGRRAAHRRRRWTAPLLRLLGMVAVALLLPASGALGFVLGWIAHLTWMETGP